MKAANPNTMVQKWVTTFVSTSEHNTLSDGTGARAWEAPLVGFARGDDPLFAFLHEDIGSFYWTPLQAFHAAFPDHSATAGDVAVICWVLPQTSRAKDDNARASDGPSETWARSRHFGEICNDELRRHMAAQFAQIGIPAAAPVLTSGWGWGNSPKYGRASNWSERHAAYVAGLGTFGLSDGLITRAGKAHRCGSVVARMQLKPTPRPYHDIHEYCLFYNGGKCQACVNRCPVNAISPAGHNKKLCEAFVTGAAAAISQDRYNIPTTPCGLCQTAVPCASGIPRR